MSVIVREVWHAGGGTVAGYPSPAVSASGAPQMETGLTMDGAGNDGDKLSADYLRGACFGIRLLAWLVKAALLTMTDDPARALDVAMHRAIDAIEKRSEFERLADLDLTTVA